MANISFFYPDREKGWALGLNAAGGNIGVSTVQLLVPIMISYRLRQPRARHPARQAADLPAERRAHVDPAHRCSRRRRVLLHEQPHQRALDLPRSARRGRHKHTWIMAWLYIGTFGSFIGYSAAFPLLLKTQFPTVTMSLAFLGPLVGRWRVPWAASWPKVGGARVTLWNFSAMGAAAVRRDPRALCGILLAGSSTMFLAPSSPPASATAPLFRMIPVDLPPPAHAGAPARARGRGRAGARVTTPDGRAPPCSASRRRSAPAAVISSPVRFGASIKATGDVSNAFGASCFSM